VKAETMEREFRASAKAHNKLGIDSIFLKAKEDIDLLRNDGFNGREYSLELLMRGSRDGFDCKKFHELCDDRGPTLTIVESTLGKVFGCYTAVKWASVDGKYLPDPNAFIFSLTNRKVLKQHRFKGYAVQHDSNHMVVFGRGNDVCIKDKCNIKKESFCNIGDTYDTPANSIVAGSFEARSYLAGECLFKVKEIEIFKVTLL
jgi:hypothetical protein